MVETSFFRDSYAVHLAIYLLFLANWEDRKTVFNGEEITVLRGQLITGRHQLSTATGIPPSTIRNKLDLLKKLRFLDSETNNRFTKITICKYEEYQTMRGRDRTAVRTAKGQQKDSQWTHLKELKELKELKTINIPSLKKPFGSFENVFLTEEEYAKLEKRFNGSLRERIESLSEGIASKGYKYKSHYATILSWDRKNSKVETGGRSVREI